MAWKPVSQDFEVFLSHNSADKAEVEQLAGKLEVAGIKVWLDKRSLIPGEPWQEGLEEGLRKSRTVVVALGSHGIGPWQNEELRAALDSRARDSSRRVIPVLLPGAEPNQNPLPPFLSRMTWVDFRSGLDNSEAFERLLAGIQGKSPGPRTSKSPSFGPKDFFFSRQRNLPCNGHRLRRYRSGAWRGRRGCGWCCRGWRRSRRHQHRWRPPARTSKAPEALTVSEFQSRALD